MDKHPKPMKDFMPVETVDNAADQFQKTHQAVYEARVKHSQDRVQAVENHNRACPKLEDELQKRRSILRVTTDEAKMSVLKIGACRKSPSHNRKKSNIKSRRAGRTLNNRNKNNNLKRKTQKKHHNENKKKKLKSMIGTCPRCLSALRREKGMPLCFKRSVQNIFTAKEFDKSQSEDVVSLRVRKERSKEDRISTSNPDTSNQSIMSYHSFASMDKEPMLD